MLSDFDDPIGSCSHILSTCSNPQVVTCIRDFVDTNSCRKTWLKKDNYLTYITLHLQNIPVFLDIPCTKTLGMRFLKHFEYVFIHTATHSQSQFINRLTNYESPDCHLSKKKVSLFYCLA